LVVLGIFAFDARMIVRTYAVEIPGANEVVRAALITDLHSCRYGKNQQKLVDAVRAENPALIFLVGDLFDDRIPDDNTEIFLKAIVDEYPCYYVTGNHEYWSKGEKTTEKLTFLQKSGVRILSGEVLELELGAVKVSLAGIEDPSYYYQQEEDKEIAKANFMRQLAELAAKTAEDSFTILLSHRPEYAKDYAALGFELVLSGHAHGGQWRIPGILNGLYAPNQGLFPKYAGGRYDLGETTVIVSRGLARESTWIPRIFNRPELVMLELGKILF